MDSKPLDSLSFFERASESAAEYRKTLMGMSSGSLAVFFLALTANVEPSLTRFQRGALVVALIMMSFSVSAALVSLVAYNRWSYTAAKVVQTTGGDKKSWEAENDRQYKTMGRADLSIAFFFLAGVLAAAAYLLSRLLNS